MSSTFEGFYQQGGKRVHVGAHSTVHPWAVLGDGVALGSHCVVDGGAVVGEGARHEGGASIDPDRELGAGAFLGPGARLLDRTRLPTRGPGRPANVGEQTRIGGNAVVCGGITVGKDAIISAGESEEVQGDLEGRVEDDVPDTGVWMGGELTAVSEGPTWEWGRIHHSLEPPLPQSRQRDRTRVRPRRSRNGGGRPHHVRKCPPPDSINDGDYHSIGSFSCAIQRTPQ